MKWRVHVFPKFVLNISYHCTYIYPNCTILNPYYKKMIISKAIEMLASSSAAGVPQINDEKIQQ